MNIAKCCSAIFMTMKFMQFLLTVIAFHFELILYPTQPSQWLRQHQSIDK